MKRPYRPRTLDEVDVGLEDAIDALRSYCRHVPHGRVFLEVERHRDVTFAHHLDRDALTRADVLGVMREMPHREGR